MNRILVFIVGLVLLRHRTGTIAVFHRRETGQVHHALDSTASFIEHSKHV
jgi:hypothetical protein